MDKIQQLIIDTYNAKPKHFSQMLKRNKEVLAYIKLYAGHLSHSSFLEQLYYVVHKTSNICPYGNIQPLKTFAGYSFCGKAGVCKCANESVSKSVSVSKQLYTQEQKTMINETRTNTNIRLYGVSNTGQTVKAKDAHKKFYENEDAVAALTEQIKSAKLENHGNENFNNREKAENTCLEKYGVRNTWSLTDDKQNPLLIHLKDKEKLSLLYPKLSVEEIGSQLSVHPHTVYRYLATHKFREPYKSTFEKEIIFYLNSLGITNIITNKRNIIGKELDIFLPDYNLAIEYNGVYWHHDGIPHITKTYHYDKFIACEKQGIELFTIFSDSWENKKDVWKAKIKAKLKLSPIVVYARKTAVVSMTASETKEFLDSNHIQGYCAAQYCYGLKYENNIVAIMTFSKSRTGIGKDRGDSSYELVRYVTSCNVVGGASKLLAHFVKIKKPLLVVSYSDNQYSIGNLYRILGFALENENKAGYRYYNPNDKKCYHRYNFTKYKLVSEGFSPDKTEFEIMDERGFLRIWDCGTRTWILKLKE